MRFLLVLPGERERRDIERVQREVLRAHNLMDAVGGAAFALLSIASGRDPAARVFSLARWRPFSLPLASFDGLLAVGESPRVRELCRQAEAAGQRVWPVHLFDRTVRDLFLTADPTPLSL